MFEKLKGWYVGLPRWGRGLLKWGSVLLAAPTLVMAMKALLGLLIVGGMLLLGPREERIGPEHYQYMYGVIEDWNRHASQGGQRESLLGHGEYMYNSHLLLFPRDTPGTLKEFYFAWEAMGFDADGFAAYFTCEMTEADYAGFAQGLADFAITTDAGVLKPIYDTEHFQHPAYILQWLDADGKWEALEYIMLDEANRTAVFVYNTIGMREKVEEHSTYATTPTTLDILGGRVFHERSAMPFTYRPEDGFTIYAGFDTAEYDLSFLEFLK